MKVATIPIACLIGSSLSGCASIPEATYTYWPGVTDIKVTITETVDCDLTKQNLLVVAAVDATPTITADRTFAHPITFSPRALGGSSADIENAFGWTEDGRLKSVSSSAGGQGEVILKTAISIAGLALTAAAAADGKVKQPSEVCKSIAQAGDKKPVTIVYSGIWHVADHTISTVPLATDVIGEQLHLAIPNLPIPVVTIPDPIRLIPTVSGTPRTNDAKLKLYDVGRVSVVVKTGVGADWSRDIIVPMQSTYVIPVPKAALFGKGTFSLGLSDAGAITAISYNQSSGAPGVMNVLSAGATTFGSKSVADQAAEVKAQADLIAQTTRLVECQKDSTNCK